MNILVDTHVFLWFITNNKRLADQLSAEKFHFEESIDKIIINSL